MRNVEARWVGTERAKARICAQVQHPPAVLGAWEVLGIGVVERPAAERDEFERALTAWRRLIGHSPIVPGHARLVGLGPNSIAS